MTNLVPKRLLKLREILAGGAKKYLINSGWVLLEHFLKAVVGIAVGVYVGRYLGPERFGILNYIIVVASLVLAASKLGFDGLLVREFIDRHRSAQIIAGTAFWSMTVSAVFFGLILVAILYFSEQRADTAVFGGIVLVGVVLQSFSVVDWYYQSKVSNGVVVKCRVVGVVVATLLKIAAIYYDLGLVAFFVIYSVEYFCLALLYLYISQGNEWLSGFLTVFSYEEAKLLLKESWPLLVSALAVILYTRIDQVMIKAMLGDYQVGVYSASLKFYDAWTVVPYLISVSLLPAIRRSKELGEEVYVKRLVVFFRMLFWSSLLVGLVLAVFADNIISYTYGQEYSDSADVLGVVMLTTAWVALGNCTSRYLIVEKMGGKIAVRTVYAAFLNIVLNFFLIPKFGVIGAAYGTLVSTFFANYLFDFFDKDLRQLREVKNRAIFLFGRPSAGS